MVTKQRNFEMEWAKMHLDTLDAQLAALRSKPENLYRVITEQDTKLGLFIIKTKPIGAIHVL